MSCGLSCLAAVSSHFVRRFAFYPPSPSYQLNPRSDKESYELIFNTKFHGRLPVVSDSSWTAFYLYTRHCSRIACIFVPASESLCVASHKCLSFGRLNKKHLVRTTNLLPSHRSLSLESCYTVLFSHGNAVDIGQLLRYIQTFACHFFVNVLCYDYSGYGASSGNCSEANMYADAEAALDWLLNRRHVPVDRVVLYGQSLGTAPTVHLATLYEVAGVILEAPLMSGLRIVFPNLKCSFPCDPFVNIDKVEDIRSPTLIIHGTSDMVVPVRHGRELFARLSNSVKPSWIYGAGHNNLNCFREYVIRLSRFFEYELQSAQRTSSCSPLQDFLPCVPGCFYCSSINQYLPTGDQSYVQSNGVRSRAPLATFDPDPYD